MIALGKIMRVGAIALGFWIQSLLAAATRVSASSPSRASRILVIRRLLVGNPLGQPIHDARVRRGAFPPRQWTSLGQIMHVLRALGAAPSRASGHSQCSAFAGISLLLGAIQRHVPELHQLRPLIYSLST